MYIEKEIGLFVELIVVVHRDIEANKIFPTKQLAHVKKKQK